MDALIEELLTRVQRSYELLEAYEAQGAALSDREIGYAQGIREEIGFLERMLELFV